MKRHDGRIFLICIFQAIILAALAALMGSASAQDTTAAKSKTRDKSQTAPQDIRIAGGRGILQYAPTTVNPVEIHDEGIVLTGLDVLEREGFKRLKGRRVGLIVNQTSINREGRHHLDLVLEHPEVKVVALFSPEHGFRGIADERVASGREESTSLPLYSLYGETRRPTDEMLVGIDTLVFDLQSNSARFSTTISTMGMCMEEASKRGIKYVVLDRPNPIGGLWFDGPIQDEDLVGKFISFKPMPIFPGMTVGELALLFKTHYGIGADLEVVKMKGWKRGMFADETGLPWVNPSPNMRSVNEQILYTMVALTEYNRDVSVGRGTDRPFEYIGAPWINGEKLAKELCRRHLPGLWFSPMVFVPSSTDITGRKNYPYPHTGKACHGVRIVVTNRMAVKPVEAGIHLLHALLKVHPDRYTVDGLRGLVGAGWVLEALKKGDTPEQIITRWRQSEEFQAFAQARATVLLY